MQNLFSPRQRILLWLACSAIFFEAFDVSIVNLALPLIASDLRIPLASAQWVQTVYVLSFGGFLLLGGRLSDYAGSRRIFLLGMLIFGGASALAWFSNHFWLLLPARAAQGIGAALAMPAGISLLSRHFPEGEPQRAAFGIFGAFAAVGFAGGLALGGMIAALTNWHWIFGINIPVIGLVLVAGYSFIPRTTVTLRVPLNGWIACWLTATLLLFCYGVHEMGHLGWKALPLLLAAGLSAAGLRRFDGRQTRPFFGSKVYASPAAHRALGAFTLLGACFIPFVSICTLSLYETMGWGILSTGLLLFPYSIGSALVSRWWLPRLFRRMKVTQVGFLAMGLLLAGDGLLAAGIHSHRLICYLGALLLVNSLSIAIGYPAFTLLTLAGVHPEKQGIAAGLQSSLYTIGTGVGLSLTGLCLQTFQREPPGVALIAGCGMIGLLCVGALWLLRSKKVLPLPPDLK